MTDSARELERELDSDPRYRDLLFRRGYLVTTDPTLDLNAFPFYGNWKVASLGVLSGCGEIRLLNHRDTPSVVIEQSGRTFALVGHAFNPFTGVISEKELLYEAAVAFESGRDTFLSKISEFTGTHVVIVRSANELLLVQDAHGFKACYYGSKSGEIFIAQHPQLVADIRSLNRAPAVEALLNTRAFHLSGRYLPGSVSPFIELKRLGPNRYLSLIGKRFLTERFFPAKDVQEVDSRDYARTLQQVGDLLHQSLSLISRKWHRPGIGLAGGVDSRTTLAVSAGLRQDFEFFSYHAKADEQKDAAAAAVLCDAVGLPHSVYPVPDDNDKLPDFGLLKRLIDHNTSYFKKTSDHELRKLLHLRTEHEFDVEVKSWCSETARVYAEGKYLVPLPKRLSPRHLSIFQTRYFRTPQILAWSDARYRDFIEESSFDEASRKYEAGDLFLWELRYGSWGASVMTAADFAYETVILYNNRRLLELFLTVPREKRKTDEAHRDLMNLFDPRILETEVDVRNVGARLPRRLLETGYYLYRTLPTSVAQAVSGRISRTT